MIYHDIKHFIFGLNFTAVKKQGITCENGIIRQNLNKQIKINHLAPAQFFHIPGFYRKTLFLNNYRSVEIGFVYHKSLIRPFHTSLLTTQI